MNLMAGMHCNSDFDLRDIIFKDIDSKIFTARIVSDYEGVISGTKYARVMLLHLGLVIKFMINDGEKVSPGDVICIITGNPKQISLAEERVIGKFSKFSGIATASRKAAELAGGKCRIAVGACKKMPPEIKMQIREAVEAGGAVNRLVDEPFIYLDKNYVSMFGGISETLNAVKDMTDYIKVIQLKGKTGDIAEEAKEGVEANADVLMIDTGKVEDLKKVIEVLNSLEVRHKIKVAFSNGVQISDIPYYVELGVELLCIGKAIIDAPLLDMKLDIV